MRGSKTGVYIGVSGSEAGEAFSKDPEELLGYSMTGCQRAMFANRLSYFFDFNGMQTFTSLITDSMLVHLVGWNWVVRIFVLNDCVFILSVWCDVSYEVI